MGKAVFNGFLPDGFEGIYEEGTFKIHMIYGLCEGGAYFALPEDGICCPVWDPDAFEKNREIFRNFMPAELADKAAFGLQEIGKLAEEKERPFDCDTIEAMEEKAKELLKKNAAKVMTDMDILGDVGRNEGFVRGVLTLAKRMQKELERGALCE